jgi:5-methylcytosine-specific restriction endonuclease McrA
MSKNRKPLNCSSKYITCDSPLSRSFPDGWKDKVFRERGEYKGGGFYYACPICGSEFDFSSIDYLEGDHIWPYSLFGETTWENYQLICGECNARKGNRLDVQIRKALGKGKFREIISTFLRERVSAGELVEDAILKNILTVPPSAEND